jgi:hypothetical protein
MKVYVESKSKADLIRRLSAGEEITGYNYSIFGGGGHYMLDDTLEDGTIIAIYSQMSGGSPVAKSWGTWTNGVLKAESFEAEESEYYIHVKPKYAYGYELVGPFSNLEEAQIKAHNLSLYKQRRVLGITEGDNHPPKYMLTKSSCDMCGADKSNPCACMIGPEVRICADKNYYKWQSDSIRYSVCPCSVEINKTYQAETFESPVSCKICGKTFASFRGLNGHMNAHIPTHRKRAEECEHEWKMTELPLERGHKYDVGWVNAAGITSYHMVCSKCNYCTECSGTHGFSSETFEQLPYEIITTDWKSSIAPEHRPNNDNWFITGDIIFAVPDREGDYGRGEETIVRISTYGEGTTLDEAKENGIQKATEYLYDDYSRGYFTQNAETFEADEPFIVRGTWGGGVVEFSNGEVFVKVITFPVTDDSGFSGESMWVILEKGNEFEGVGILDNDPIHSDIKVGSRIKFTGGNTHYKPHFVAVVQNMEAEGDEQTIEDFFVSMSDLLTTYSGGDWEWDSEARGGVLQFSGHLTPTNGENFYQYDLDDETFEARGTSGWQVECSKCGVKGHNKSTCGKPKPKVQKKPKQKKKKYVRKTIKKEDARRNDFLKAIGAMGIGIFIGRNL